MDKLSHKLKFVIVGILVLGNLFLLSLLLPAIGGTDTAAATGPAPTSAGVYDGPNAVTNGMGSMMDTLNYTMETEEKRLNSTLHAVGAVAAQSGHFAAVSGKFITQGIYAGVTSIGRGAATAAIFTGRTMATSIVFIIRIPLSLLGFVSNAPVVSSVIKPSAAEQVPVIDPQSTTLFASHAAIVPAVQVVSQPIAQSDSTPAWPIHGEITTLFGVVHWPYQPTHTGIDISDGKPSGVTPVKPFKPGRVIDTIHSSTGLGNHVVVDHGGGLTSVYGHMYAISVSVGQEVDKNTTLGLEGTTGASTGPHVHFEIRINGQPVNPADYVPGHP